MINKARKRNIRYHYSRKRIDHKELHRSHERTGMYLKAVWLTWGLVRRSKI